MARIIIDIPDSYVDWARWAQDELAKGGLPSQETTQGAAATQSPATASQSAPSDSTGGQNVPPTNDPWAANGVTTASAPSGQQAPAQGAASASTTGPNRVTKETQYGPMVFELGLNGAEDCFCGNPSARVTASKRAGGTYTKWVCAKDAGADWKTKCDFKKFGS